MIECVFLPSYNLQFGLQQTQGFCKIILETFGLVHPSLCNH